MEGYSRGREGKGVGGARPSNGGSKDWPSGKKYANM